MSRIDLKAEYQSLYSAPEKDAVLISVPPLNYLMFDGRGAPLTSPDGAQAMEALCGLSYTLKFMSKQTFGRDYAVGPLEGLWPGPERDGAWTLMMLQPDWICPNQLAAARAEVLLKNGLPGVERARLEVFDEGGCLQILHVGACERMPEARARVDAAMAERGLIENGRSHEIYLTDWRKVAPDQRRTLLRQPVVRAK